MKNRKLFIMFSVILLIISFLIYKYTKYNKYFNNKDLNHFSFEMFIRVMNYEKNNIDLTDSINFKKMVSKINQESFLLKENNHFIENGFGLKYDSKSKFYIFYINGECSTENGNYYLIPNIDPKKVISISTPSFVEFLINGNNYNIVLFAYKKPDSTPTGTSVPLVPR